MLMDLDSMTQITHTKNTNEVFELIAKLVSQYAHIFHRKKVCYMNTLTLQNVHIPVKNSHFYTFIVASGIEHTGDITKNAIHQFIHQIFLYTTHIPK